MEFNTSASRNATMADGAIQQDEIDQFVRQRSTGRELQLATELDAGTDFTAALEAAATRATAFAATLKIQMSYRLRTLRRRIQARKDARIKLLSAAALRIQLAHRRRDARDRFRKAVEACAAVTEGNELLRLARQRTRMKAIICPEANDATQAPGSISYPEPPSPASRRVSPQPWAESLEAQAARAPPK